MGFISRSVHPFCEECELCHPADHPCVWGEPRWKFPPGFAKGDFLFNYAAARSAPFILLVEGVPDVLRAAEAGVAAVCGFGAGLSVAQTAKLSALNKPVVVAFDNDEAGQKGGPSVVELLRQEGLSAVLRHPPAQFKDLAEMRVEAVKEWLAA